MRPTAEQLQLCWPANSEVTELLLFRSDSCSQHCPCYLQVPVALLFRAVDGTSSPTVASRRKRALAIENDEHAPSDLTQRGVIPLGVARAAKRFRRQ